MALQLWRGTRSFGAATRLDQRLRRRLPRIGIATAVMAATVAGACGGFSGALEADGLRYIALGAVILVGAGSYLGTYWMLGGLRRRGSEL